MDANRYRRNFPTSNFELTKKSHEFQIFKNNDIILYMPCFLDVGSVNFPPFDLLLK
jgi:hypothetical protein